MSDTKNEKESVVDKTAKRVLNKTLQYQEATSRFFNEILEQTYLSKEELAAIIEPEQAILAANILKNPEELNQLLLTEISYNLNSSLIKVLESGNNTLIPGYNFKIAAGNTKITVYGGNFGNNRELTENAIFDIASISKMYTQVIACNLISEEVFDFDSKISKLERFKNLGDLTVGDIMSFGAKFQTPMRLDEATTKGKAERILDSTQVLEKGQHNYNDIGMIILKEYMEAKTGVEFEGLFNYYIKERLNLRETYLKLPKDKIKDFTGSAADIKGQVNDPKAVILGGASGHAGVKVTADDLLMFQTALFMSDAISPLYNPSIKEALPKEYIELLYKAMLRKDRGTLGNSKIATPEGLKTSDMPITGPKIGSAVDGSTRVVSESGIYKLNKRNIITAGTICLNPSSMSLEMARQLEKELGVSIVKEYYANGKKYYSIDTRKVFPPEESTDLMNSIIGETQIKLLYLQELMRSYHQNLSIQKEEVIHTNR